MSDKICPQCNQAFTTTTRRVYCSKDCRHLTRAEKGHKLVVGSEMNRTQTGTLSELLVCVDLLKQGYHVFRAISAACPCDLIAFRKDGKVVRIEVKTVWTTDSGKILMPTLKNQEFDVLAVVFEGGIKYYRKEELESLHK